MTRTSEGKRKGGGTREGQKIALFISISILYFGEEERGEGKGQGWGRTSGKKGGGRGLFSEVVVGKKRRGEKKSD